MEEAYFNLFMAQFKKAIGSKKSQGYSKTLISEFSEWLKSMESTSKHYLQMLENMGVNKFTDSSTFEIGKGLFDSIVMPFDTTIITPHSYMLNVEPSRIITSNFMVCDGSPIMFKAKGMQMIESKPITSNTVQTFMTQNPYSDMNIRNWEQLHNSGKNDIIVGVYGSIHDKDMDSKLKQISVLKSKLNGNYVEENATINDAYCYAIASKRK